MTLAELIEEALMTNTDVASEAGLSVGTVSSNGQWSLNLAFVSKKSSERA